MQEHKILRRDLHLAAVDLFLMTGAYELGDYKVPKHGLNGKVTGGMSQCGMIVTLLTQ